MSISLPLVRQGVQSGEQPRAVASVGTICSFVRNLAEAIVACDFLRRCGGNVSLLYVLVTGSLVQSKHPNLPPQVRPRSPVWSLSPL